MAQEFKVPAPGEVNGNGVNTCRNGEEKWSSKIGLILAMAGNAIGLGNFLRFPCKAASNGGGAFMIPYFIALLLLGIPLMWIEWGMGRFGGKQGHSTLPGAFDRIWRHPVSKYIGVLGIVLPLLIVIYYNYIESWTFSYAYFSLTGSYSSAHTRDEMGAFLNGYTGKSAEQFNFSYAEKAGTQLIPSDLLPVLRVANGGMSALERIVVPLRKGVDAPEGVYIISFEFTAESGKKIQGRTSFVYISSRELAPYKTTFSSVLPDELRSITPANGAVVAAVPDKLVFEFSEKVRLEGVKLSAGVDNSYLVTREALITPKYYGQGEYILEYAYENASGKKITGRTSYSVCRGSLKAPPPGATGRTELPAEVEAIEPEPGKVMDMKPEQVRIIFREDIKNFSAVGSWRNTYFSGFKVALIFFFITFAINIFVLYKGVECGIERLAKIAMPTLFLFAVIIALRVLTLPPNPNNPEWNVLNGLGFIWNPRFDMLWQSSVWLAAAGQIFFTLSICTGAIQGYASLLKDEDDIALNGLTTAATNEFAEIVLGGTIAIPAAVVFFGVAQTEAIARSGAFNLGFNSMPLIFQQIGAGWLFGTMWFALLFFAGITSSVALSFPAILFLKHELGWSHSRAVTVVGSFILLASLPVIFFFHHGYLDEMDFWAGTFLLALFGLIEVILFCWIFGMDSAWEEMHKGSLIRIPRVFYYIMKYITPVYLLILLIAWGWQDGRAVLFMSHVPPESRPYLWLARAVMLGILGIFCYWVKVAWDRKSVSDSRKTDTREEAR